MDLRRPAGLLFSILGVLVLSMGLLSPERARLTDANVNLWSGAVILGFGLILTFLGYRRHS